MTTLIAFLTALPSLIIAILDLMKLAEEAFPETGTGATKKEMIMEAMKKLFSIGDDLWDKVQKAISAIITVAAVFKFGSKPDN